MHRKFMEEAGLLLTKFMNEEDILQKNIRNKKDSTFHSLQLYRNLLHANKSSDMRRLS
jgi:hypothetical protein